MSDTTKKPPASYTFKHLQQERTEDEHPPRAHFGVITAGLTIQLKTAGQQYEQASGKVAHDFGFDDVFSPLGKWRPGVREAIEYGNTDEELMADLEKPHLLKAEQAYREQCEAEGIEPDPEHQVELPTGLDLKIPRPTGRQKGAMQPFVDGEGLVKQEVIRAINTHHELTRIHYMRHQAKCCAIMAHKLDGHLALLGPEFFNGDNKSKWPAMDWHAPEAAISARVHLLLNFLDARDLDGMYDAALAHKTGELPSQEDLGN